LEIVFTLFSFKNPQSDHKKNLLIHLDSYFIDSSTALCTCLNIRLWEPYFSRTRTNTLSVCKIIVFIFIAVLWI